MDDLLQQDSRADFIIKCGEAEYPAFSSKNSDAYLACYQIAQTKNQDAQCYYYHKSEDACAVSPVFQIKGDCAFLSGVKFKL